MNQFSSSIWVKLDVEPYNKNNTTLQTTTETKKDSNNSSEETSSSLPSSPSTPKIKIPSWLQERIEHYDKKNKNNDDEKVAVGNNKIKNELECGVTRKFDDEHQQKQPSLSSSNGKLTPPPIPFNLFSSSSSSSSQTTTKNKNDDVSSNINTNTTSANYADSLVNLVHKHQNQHLVSSASSSSTTTTTTNPTTLVSEQSEKEAIKISDLPSEIIQALPELRFIPKWVRSEQESMLTGNNGTQDVIVVNNNNSKKPPTAKNGNSNNNNLEVLVLGVFGPGFGMWRKIRKASIRRPQNHSASFLFSAENNNTNTDDIDDESVDPNSNGDDAIGFGNTWTNHHHQKRKFSNNNSNNKFMKKKNHNNNNFIINNSNPRLFVTISYLRHATMCKDLESIKNFIDPEELDPESLESFLSKEKRKNIHDSKIEALSHHVILDNDHDDVKKENNKKSDNDDDDDDYGKKLRSRGMGPLRSCLETFLSESRGHSVANFPRQTRQVKYVNFDQMKEALLLESSSKTKEENGKDVSMMNVNNDIDESQQNKEEVANA